jgi:choice-of-anchor B domain-containing protein
MKTPCSFGLIVLLTLTQVASTSAQGQLDRFGSAVAVVGPNVVVLKPTNSRGPATVYLFGEDESGHWAALDRFYPAAASHTGEAFGQSLDAADGLILVASGDPKSFWGGTVLAYDATEGWHATGRLPLVDTAAVVEGELDLAGIMSILRPARRVVATDGHLAVVAVLGGGGAAGVRIYRLDDSGLWLKEADLAPAEGDRHQAFGTSLILSGDRVVVGSPNEDDHGAVFVFMRSATGEWHQDARLTPEDVEVRGFGSALVFDGDRVVVGARGSGTRPGAVTTYGRDEATGGWVAENRLMSPDDAPEEGFGAALAVYGDELWIGAPNADDGAGQVHRFTRDGSGGPWTASGSVMATAVESGYQFGASLAVGDALAVVGAPGADGNAGRAVVVDRTDSGWVEAAMLDDGLRSEMIVGNETRCEGGRAAQFTCDRVDLLAYLPVETFGGGAGEGVSDLWGWTDPVTGHEYALIGRVGGAAFVDITDPVAPVYLGTVPANNSLARDLKVYRDHLFFTGDGAGDHGLVVFDLTRLRDVTQPPVTFEPDARYTGIASAHNLILDPESGYAYPVGASGGGTTCGGGLHMVDIRDPVNPSFAGCYTDTEGLLWAGRTHDGQCVVYRGPDEGYQGRQICFASNETALRIVDVTDKDSPVPLAAATYPGRAYIHQGWLTDDQRFFYLDDELDELVGQTERTRTLILDVADLDDPVVVGEYLGSTSASDHNLYIKGDRMYQANYRAGLQIIDISDRENPVEIGGFDTTPYDDGNPPGFSGAWTAYPFFESGVVVVSSWWEGLFIVKPSPHELVP